MENIIPVLIVVGGLIYKIYQNYQEEMEKARKRQQAMPRKQGQSKPVVMSRPDTSSKKTTTANTPKQPNASPPPLVYDRKLGRPQPRKIERRPALSKPEDLKKIYQEQQEAAEVTRAREQREKKLLDRKIEVVKMQEDAEQATAIDAQDFDLRQAVIQAAILERPHAY